MSQILFPQVVERLHAQFGKEMPPKLVGPWEMILWEWQRLCQQES
jgi:hypothetical protein